MALITHSSKNILSLICFSRNGPFYHISVFSLMWQIDLFLQNWYFGLSVKHSSWIKQGLPRAGIIIVSLGGMTCLLSTIIRQSYHYYYLHFFLFHLAGLVKHTYIHHTQIFVLVITNLTSNNSYSFKGRQPVSFYLVKSLAKIRCCHGYIRTYICI
jgi:hypothetical protein